MPSVYNIIAPNRRPMTPYCLSHSPDIPRGVNEEAVVFGPLLQGARRASPRQTSLFSPGGSFPRMAGLPAVATPVCPRALGGSVPWADLHARSALSLAEGSLSS